MHLCTQGAGARRYVCETERLLLGLHVDVVRQTGDVERGQLSLDEGPCVSKEVFRHLGVILVHPAQRHLLLEICDLADGVQLSGTLIGAVGDALQGHHLAGDALKRSLDSSTADLIGLGDVGAAGQVAGAALQGGKLDAAGLGVQIAGHDVGQIAGGAGQGLVAESVHCVDIVGQLTDIAAILELDALRHRDDDAGLLLLHHAHLLDEVLHMEGDFGQADHVHALAVVALGQCGGGGQPAGVAAHDLDDGDILGAVDGGVADDLLHHHADVLGRRAVAGSVVGDHQIVVDGLRHAHEADVALDALAVLSQLADGVHRVVAADVEEAADVQLFEDGEELLVQGLVGVPVGQLVAAAAEEAGGGALEQLDVEVIGQQGGQVHDPLLQQTGDAVAHAVDDVRAAALAALEHTSQTCVDDRGGAAGLANDCIFTHDDFSFFVFLFRLYNEAVF